MKEKKTKATKEEKEFTISSASLSFCQRVQGFRWKERIGLTTLLTMNEDLVHPLCLLERKKTGLWSSDQNFSGLIRLLYKRDEHNSCCSSSIVSLNLSLLFMLKENGCEELLLSFPPFTFWWQDESEGHFFFLFFRETQFFFETSFLIYVCCFCRFSNQTNNHHTYTTRRVYILHTHTHTNTQTHNTWTTDKNETVLKRQQKRLPNERERDATNATKHQTTHRTTRDAKRENENERNRTRLWQNPTDRHTTRHTQKRQQSGGMKRTHRHTHIHGKKANALLPSSFSFLLLCSSLSHKLTHSSAFCAAIRETEKKITQNTKKKNNNNRKTRRRRIGVACCVFPSSTSSQSLSPLFFLPSPPSSLSFSFPSQDKTRFRKQIKEEKE